MDQTDSVQDPSLMDLIAMDDEDSEFEPNRLNIRARSADL